MQQRKIILFIAILFLISASYLLALGNKFNTLDFGKDWWDVYFENPKDNSLNFTIENHTANTNFHYVILADKDKIKEEDVTIVSGQSATIPSPVSGLSAPENNKITIEVSAGDNDKKSIYKNF